LDDARILDRYAALQRERGLSADTLRHYRTIAGGFSRWLADRGLSLTDCDEAHVREWVFVATRAVITHRQYVSRLDVFFRWMVDEGYRDHSPTRRVQKPREARGLPRPISTVELLRALELANPRTGAMLALAAYAGMRRAEIARLTVEDLLDGEPALVRIHGKGQKVRLVPTSAVVHAAIDRYEPPASGPLFVSRRGNALHPQAVGDRIAGHLRACRIDATAHQCRHWFATELYRACGDLVIVQNMLGHAHVSTTQIYVAWSPTRAAAAIAALPSPTVEAA
jgi:site-specific recombinase XerD